MAKCFLRLALSTAVQQRRLGGDGAVQLPRVGSVILQEYLEGSLPSSAAISVEKVITLAEVILGAPGLAAP